MNEINESFVNAMNNETQVVQLSGLGTKGREWAPELKEMEHNNGELYAQRQEKKV